MNEQAVTEKTPEQMRADLYNQVLKQQGASGQHLCEVATPGVVRMVNPNEISK